MENNFLNDKMNLNPSMEAIKSVVTGNQPPKELTPEKKEEEIQKWNENPAVKKNGVKAIDTDEEKSVKKWKWKLFIFLAIAGIIFLLIVASVAGIFGYTVYKDGSLKSVLNFTCAPVFNAPENNCTNTCGDCKLDCGNVTFKSEIKICGNQTC